MNRRKTFRQQRARRAAAHHEAGHAVMAWTQGLTVRSASIRPVGETGGQVIIDC